MEYAFKAGDRVHVDGTVSLATVNGLMDAWGTQVHLTYENGTDAVVHAMFLRHVRPDEKEG